jgi:putative nucleotidyltransferase with HDIG domain
MTLSRSLFVGVLVASAAPVAVFAILLVSTVAGLPDGPALAPMLRAAAIAAAMSAAIAALVAAVVARRLVLPIRRCLTGALEIARGRFGHQVAVATRSEVGDLAYTFNYMSRELASYDAENRRLIGELEAGWLATIRSLASAIDAKDPSTRGHSQRVSQLAVEVGRELDVGTEVLEALAWGGLLHDVGKIGVPETILGKAGALTPAELDAMRAHPAIGAEIVRDASFLCEASKAVRSHHERFDGTGYPDGLSGEQIPLVARIVAVADTFDACTSERPYQPTMTVEEALVVMERLRGAQTDPRVHDALVRVVRGREAGRAPAAEAR